MRSPARDVFMQAALTGAVYAFSADGFAKMEKSVNHYVGLKAVPLRQTQQVVEIKSAADAMRHGLQIFTFANPFPKTPADPQFPDLRDFRFARDAGPLLATGELVWENDARGINPDPKLREILGLVR